VQNFGEKSTHDLRLCARIDGWPDVTAQVAALRKHGAGKVFREVASGAKTDRAQLRRLLDQLDAGDVLLVTRLDRLALSTHDLLNTLAAIAGRKAGFRSLGDAWADTTDGTRPLDADRARRAGGVRTRSYPGAHRGGPGPGRGAQAENGATAQTNAAPEARGHQAPRSRRGISCRHRAQLQCQRGDDFSADSLTFQ
jgi:hypothetical protein